MVAFLPAPIPTWSPCLYITVQSIFLEAPWDPCAMAILFPYFYPEYCICFHSFAYFPDQRKYSLWFQSFRNKWQQFCRSVLWICFPEFRLEVFWHISDCVGLIIKSGFVLLPYCYFLCTLQSACCTFSCCSPKYNLWDPKIIVSMMNFRRNRNCVCDLLLLSIDS